MIAALGAGLQFILDYSFQINMTFVIVLPIWAGLHSMRRRS